MFAAFASLVEIYSKHVQVGMPHVEDAIETMAQLENERAKKEALSLYCLKMVEYVKMPVPDDEKLDNLHGVWRRKALDMYSSRAMPGGAEAIQQQLEVRTCMEPCSVKCAQHFPKLDKIVSSSHKF